jgi:integrase/recombinase XerD
VVIMKIGGRVTLAVVRDLRDARGPAGPEGIAAFETDSLAGFVLARSAAGLADSTVARDVIHLEQVRAWLARPLWEMQPADADAYFGQVLRGAAKGTRLARAQALKTYFLFLELRHKVEIHQMTGHVVQCPLDELNRPRGSQPAALRIPPSEAEIGILFAGWRDELAGCRKFAPSARNYAAARLMADVGLRVNEACQLDLADIKWELGRFGKIHVRMGKGARGSGPRERMVPLINGARATLEWFVRDVWSCFDDDHVRPGAPLLPSERKNPDGTCARVGDEAIRSSLADAAETHLPGWQGKITPHLLRHFCAGQLYANGMELTAVQEVLGHSWIVTTMNYIHVHRTNVEDAWIAGQERAARRLTGLSS